MYHSHPNLPIFIALTILTITVLPSGLLKNIFSKDTLFLRLE
jgi:hypothetical protein